MEHSLAQQDTEERMKERRDGTSETSILRCADIKSVSTVQLINQHRPGPAAQCYLGTENTRKPTRLQAGVVTALLSVAVCYWIIHNLNHYSG